MQLRREWLGELATCGLALGLTFVFWLPIWCGAGFVGGDIYSYFFPQKVIYSEALHAGELPLWNERAGFGYPLLAESQTGIFYPPNLVLYRLLDPHSAFHVSFLLHYFLAFLFASAAARRLGLGLLPSWLSALVYVYGWFPPRTCVEWAIIGGAWLPAALWCAESFLSTRLWRFAIGLSGVLAVQLLAGHFQIAWFTLLLLAVYVPSRVFWFWDNGHRLSANSQRLDSGCREPMAISQPYRIIAVVFVAMFCGANLAAVQLLPTYELKQRSQRASVGKDHELDFGSIPLWYWMQVDRPSHFYSPLTNREQLFSDSPPLGHARTNSTEAHLYFGLVPFTLVAAWMAWVVMRLIRGGASRNELRPLASALGLSWFWWLIGVLSLWYTSGLLLSVTRHLPGFSYFQGPGRYGLLTTWATAILAGLIVCGQATSIRVGSPDSTSCRERPRWLAVVILLGTIWSWISVWSLAGDADFVASEAGVPHPLVILGSSVLTSEPVLGLMIVGSIAAGVSAWSMWRSESARVGWNVLFLVTFTVTTLEFWMISRLVTFTQIVESPPLKSLEISPVRRTLLEVAKTRPTLRLFAPGANLPSTLGMPSAPVYLTFGPAEYVDDSLRLPVAEGTTVVPGTLQQLDWLRRVGVTHVLCFEPPAMASAMKLIWKGDDPFLNRAWGRAGQPLFLYEIENSLGRLQLQSANGERREPNSWLLTAFESRAGLVECAIEIHEAGLLVLADLDYPGWSVTVDGRPAESMRVDGQFRGVRLAPGSHRVIWSYRPRSVLWGTAISLSTLLFLATVAHVRFWHPRRLRWLEEAESSSAAPAR